MDIGKPQREIYVEPLQLPEPLRPEAVPDREPAAEPPVPVPVKEPEKEPAHV